MARKIRIESAGATYPVRRRRVGERLGMGEEARVTQALRQVRSGSPLEWQRLKEQLEVVYATGGEAQKI